MTLATVFVAMGSAFAGDMPTATLKGKVLHLDFSSPVAEREGGNLTLGLGGLNTTRNTSLLNLEAVLASAANDPAIAMIFMKPDNLSAGRATTEEIRTMILRFKESGKPVVAYAKNMSVEACYLASAADYVIMNPSGTGQFLGVGTSQYFIKDLLDTLGLDIQLIRHGQYKSAGEMYIRNDFSPANREQYERLLNTIWQSRLQAIAEGRGLRPCCLNRLAETLALDDAQSWKAAGLVDTLMYRDQVEEFMCSLFKADELSDIKAVTPATYNLRNSRNRNKIAVIYADGTIGDGSDIGGDAMARTIAEVRRDESVKAVVFRVNSPGGEVTASDLIRREILMLQQEKPVVASYGNYAASGGYWISSSASRIFCSNSTLTGSIGVFGTVPAIGNALRKNLHVNMVTIGTNSHSGMLSGIDPLTDEELEWYQRHIDSIYENFVSLVAENRGMEVAVVDSLAQGRVWSGVDAIQNGLADEIGTLMDAILYVAKEAGLDKFSVVSYPEVEEFSLRSLLGKDKDKNTPLVQMPYIVRYLSWLAGNTYPATMALPEAIFFDWQ